MTPPRQTFAWSAALALLAVALGLGPARGQFRNPRPGLQPRPGFNGGQPVINPPNFNGGQPGFNPNPMNPPAGVIGGPPGLNPGNPPGMNPPGMPGGGQVLIQTWTCSRCGKEMSRGTDAPPATCPHCGAHIINGVGGGGGPNPVGNLFGSGGGSSGPSTSSSSPESGRWKVIVLLVGISLVGVFGLVGGTWLMIYTLKSSDSGSSRRRRRRDDDDYDD